MNKTYHYMIPHGKVSPSPKTADSNRTVSIQAELAPVIDDIRALMSKISPVATDDLFFHNEEGGYIRYDGYRQYLGDCTAKVVGRRLTPHALRHTMTSLFAEAGVSLEVISRRLGHADSKITREIYFHVTKGLEKADAAAVSKVCLLR